MVCWGQGPGWDPTPPEGCLCTWRAQGLNFELHPAYLSAWYQLRSQGAEVQEDLNLLGLLQMKEKVSGKYFVSPARSGFFPPSLPLLQPHLLHLLYVKSSKLSAELITHGPLL